jgi:hypothetical protein
MITEHSHQDFLEMLQTFLSSTCSLLPKTPIICAVQCSDFPISQNNLLFLALPNISLSLLVTCTKSQKWHKNRKWNEKNK